MFACVWREFEGSVDVCWRFTVNHPTKGVRNFGVEPFERACDRRIQSAGIEHTSNRGLSRMNRVSFNKQEDEGPIAELRLKKALDARRLPGGCDEILHITSQQIDYGPKRVFATVVHENRGGSTHTGATMFTNLTLSTSWYSPPAAAPGASDVDQQQPL